MSSTEDFWRDAPDPEKFQDGDALDSVSEEDKLPTDSFDDKTADDNAREEH